MDIYQTVQRFYKAVTTQKRVIGKSLFGRQIYAIKLGEGRPVGVAQYAIHGREYITARLAIAQYFHGDIRGSIWFIPLVNPDGALLSELGVSSLTHCQEKLLVALNSGLDFSLWKANGRGVDLNVNFAAEWGKGAKNTNIFGGENCIGEKPFSEPESRALRDFTLLIQPNYTVSYHTKGEEIYWYFYQSMRTCPRDKRLAMVLSDATNYPLAYAKGSVGGYKDWCIQTLKIPAFTVEAGAEHFAHPLGEEGLQDIILHNQTALSRLSKAVW